MLDCNVSRPYRSWRLSPVKEEHPDSLRFLLPAGFYDRSSAISINAELKKYLKEKERPSIFCSEVA